MNDGLLLSFYVFLGLERRPFTIIHLSLRQITVPLIVAYTSTGLSNAIVIVVDGLPVNIWLVNGIKSFTLIKRNLDLHILALVAELIWSHKSLLFNPFAIRITDHSLESSKSSQQILKIWSFGSGFVSHVGFLLDRRSLIIDVIW